MSHRQQAYKSRGRGGGAFERLGVPMRKDGGYQHRGDFQQRGGFQQRGAFQQRGGRGGPRGGHGHRGGRGGRGNFRQHDTRTNNAAGQAGTAKEWYKVVIARGARFSKDSLLKIFNSYLDRPLWPILYKSFDGGDVTFFLDDKDVADSVDALSGRAQAPNGQKLTIRVTPNPAPCVPLDAQEEEAVKAALQHRYDAVNNHLDLSAFHLDAALQDQRQSGSNISLSRNNVMLTMADLLGKEQSVAGSIRSIDVSENRLRFLDYFACLTPRLPNVTRLVFHHNLIENINELEKLSAWNIIELDLDATPLCAKFRDKNTYIDEIRRVFKNLMKLDGADLPPATRFALEEEADRGVSTLPPLKPSFYLDDAIKNTVHQFLELYYTHFDGEESQQRQNLLPAYDDDAIFTMSAANFTPESHNARGDNWSSIMRDSHNIMKMEMWERYREKLVRVGKLAILAYLCGSFPATSHIPQSFIMDISFAAGNVWCLNVSGVFRDRGSGAASGQEPFRYFNRVMLLLQNEKGLFIINEQLFISTLSQNQYTTYMQQVERCNANVA